MGLPYSNSSYLLLLLILSVNLSNFSFADDSDGLFFASKFYTGGNTNKKDDESWKDTGDSNPWLMESPNSSKNSDKDKTATLASVDSIIKQWNNRNAGNTYTRPNPVQTPNFNSQPQQAQQMVSGNNANSESHVKDVYLQSVNTRQQVDTSQSNRNGGSQTQSWNTNPQTQNVVNAPVTQRQTVQDTRSLYRGNTQTQQRNQNGAIGQGQNANTNFAPLTNTANENRNFPSNNVQESTDSRSRGGTQQYRFDRNNPASYGRNIAPTTPTTTTTTTTTTTPTTKKSADNMFFNSWPYNTGKKKTEQEDWKKNDEPNPFLFDNPNKPRQEPQNIPNNNNDPNRFRFENPNDPRQEQQRNQPGNFPQQDSEQRGSQQNRRPPQADPPPQVWKTKWQYEEEEEMKAKALENRRNPPSSVETDRETEMDNPRPPKRKQRPFNKHSNYMHQSYDPVRREDMERSGELEEVPKSYYEGKLDKVDRNFKFMEPEPETMPLVGERHLRAGHKESYEFEEDPPSTIQKMKNWFLKSKSKSSSRNRLSFLVLIIAVLQIIFTIGP